MEVQILTVFETWQDNQVEVCVFGRDSDGRDACVRVRRVPTKLYVIVPDLFEEEEAREMCKRAAQDVSSQLKSLSQCPRTFCSCGRSPSKPKTMSNRPCLSVLLKDLGTNPPCSFGGFELKYSTTMYRRKPFKMVRVDLSGAHHAQAAFDFFVQERHGRVQTGQQGWFLSEACNVFTDAVQALMFTSVELDPSPSEKNGARGLAGFGWMRVLAAETPARKISTCSLEWVADFSSVVPLRDKTECVEWIVCSVDVASFENITVVVGGRTVQLKGVDAVRRFYELVQSEGVDVVTGHGIDDRDLPLLFHRARELKLDRPFSRLKDVSVASLTLDRAGKRTTLYRIPGRWILDAKTVARDMDVHEEFSLDFVYPFEFPNEKRGEKAVEALALITKWQTVAGLGFRAQCSGTLPDRELLDGSQKALDRLLFEFAHQAGFCVPVHFQLRDADGPFVPAYEGRPLPPKRDLDTGEETKGGSSSFSGGYVWRKEGAGWNPDQSFAILDFASLYPSIMRAYNLCPSTLVAEGEGEEDVFVSKETGNKYVKPRVRKGITGRAMGRLFDARATAKSKMDDAFVAGDLVAYENFRLLQKGIKERTNAAFGAAAAKTSKWFSPWVGDDITSIGRATIKLVRAHLQERGEDILYIDTDSLFVGFPSCPHPQAVRRGEKLASELNASKLYPELMRIKFEGAGCRLLMPALKRQAYVVNGKVETTGLDVTKRDSPGVLKVLERRILDLLLLRNASEEEIVKETRDFCSRVMRGEIDAKDWRMTAALSQSVEEYTRAGKTPPPHVFACMVSGGEKAMGDRVPFCFVWAKDETGQITKKAHLKARCFEELQKAGAKIDPAYYLVHKMRQPVLALLNEVVRDKEALSDAFEPTRYDRWEWQPDGKFIFAKGEEGVKRKRGVEAEEAREVGRARATETSVPISEGPLDLYEFFGVNR